MTPRQEQIQKDLDNKLAELRNVEIMNMSGPDEESARSEEIVTLTKAVEDLTEAYSREERAAEARAKVAAIKSQATTTRSGVVTPVPKERKPFAVPHHVMGEVRGFESPEAAYRAGTYLAALGRGEVRAASVHPMGSVDTVEPDSMGELSPTYDGKGSELVQHELYRGILNQITYQSIASRLASMFPVSTDGVYLPIGDQAPDAEWYLENCEIKPIKPKTARAQLMLHKLGARAQVSNELIADAYISLASLVAQQFADSFARKIDKTFFQGDVAIGFGGVAPAIAAGNTITAAAASPTAKEWTAVMGKVDPNTRNPVWVVSRTGWQEVMELATGTIGRDITQGVQTSIYGAPVYVTDLLPAKTVAIYGDFKMAAAIGYKANGLTIRSSADRAIEFDQMVYVATQRLAFAAHSPKYLAALKTP